MPFTEAQFIQLTLWPKFTSIMSMIGSAALCYGVLRDRQKRRLVLNRLLAAMSITDIITSVCKFLTTWPIPRGSPFVHNPIGTQATCSIQGFFIQFGIAGPLYNVFLSVYYLLTIRNRWRESRLKKIEWVMHAIPLGFAGVTSITLLVLKQYNSSLLWCGIASKPITCKGSYRNDGINDCERGNNAWIFRFAFFFAPIWIAITLATVAMFMTYRHVNEIENKSSKWTYAATEGGRRSSSRLRQHLKHSRNVATQAKWYLLSFYLSHLPGSLANWFRAANGKLIYGLFLFVAIVSPLQGFLNYLVFLRPKYFSARRKHPDWSFFHVLKEAMQTGLESEVSQRNHLEIGRRHAMSGLNQRSWWSHSRWRYSRRDVNLDTG